MLFHCLSVKSKKLDWLMYTSAIHAAFAQELIDIGQVTVHLMSDLLYILK